MALMIILYLISLFSGISLVYTKLPDTDTMRFPFLIAMIVLGALVLSSTLVVLFLNTGKIIAFTPTSIEYTQGSREFKVTWRDLVYKPPDRDRTLYRNALISNGKIFGTFDNIFFPEFEMMVKVIEMAKDIKGSGTIEL